MAITDKKCNVGEYFCERVVPIGLEVGYRLPNNPELAFFVRGLIGL